MFLAYLRRHRWMQYAVCGKIFSAGFLVAIWLTMMVRVAAAAEQAAVDDPVLATTTGIRCVSLTDAAITDRFNAWYLAMDSGDSVRISALYWPDAVVWAPAWKAAQGGRAPPASKVISRTIHHGCNWALDAGLHDVTDGYPPEAGAPIRSHYSIFYTYRNGIWRIQHQHTSIAADSKAPSSTRDDISPEFTTTAMLQLEQASRPPTALLTVEQRNRIGDETVGIKVCAGERNADRSFELSDPSPHGDANEAALTWAREARWTVSGNMEGLAAVCRHITVRFIAAEP